MNLLIIGNGLDLDLKLPTKYTDFLKFTKAFIFFMNQDIEKVYEFDTYNHNIIDSRYDKKSNSPNLIEAHEKWKTVLEKFDESFSSKFINKVCKDFFYCTYQNCWIRYFNERYEKNLIAGENWIDLESEIQNMIHSIEERTNFEIIANPSQPKKFNKNSLNLQSFIDVNSKNKFRIYRYYYEKMKIALSDDFEKFVMALGIYLDFFVTQLTPDIQNSSKELQDLMTTTSNEKSVDYVLSFNYINNFKKNDLTSEHVCFIHGAVDYVQHLKMRLTENLTGDDKEFLKIENFMNRNKMIIGFDNLQESEENFELEFVDYRKYFQRIYKGTDSSYVDWLDEYQTRLRKNIQMSTNPENWENKFQHRLEAELNCSTPNNVFIFGHSLDATDNKILKDIFLREHEDTKIKIFYHDLEARKRIIINLIKILGKSRLVEKTKGKNPVISFIKQTY